MVGVPAAADRPPSRRRTVRLRAGAATSTGNRRRQNEDAHAVGERCCVVADGMGGHAAGAVAAQIAVDTLSHAFCAAPSDPAVHPSTVRSVLAAANDAIRSRASADATPGMGTTAVGVVVVGGGSHDRLAVFHIGDSRCYRLRDGALDLVTRDHSVVQQLVDAGRLSAHDAAQHPLANVVTRALGVDPVAEPDIALLEPWPGRLLLCSDGLSNELPARTIGRVLAGVADPHCAAQRLVALALAGCARDNLTALVLDVDVVDPSAADRSGSAPCAPAHA